MKQSILSFIFILLLTGCGPETDIENEKPVLKGPLELTINNIAFDYYPEDVEVYITDQTDQKEIRLFITYADFNDPESSIISYGLGFIFKDNHFSEAVTSFVKDGKNYRSADFNPTADFHIKNYRYDPVTRDLYFEFEGKLFEVLPEVNENGGSIMLKGKVDEKQIELRHENAANRPIATFGYANGNFYPVINFSGRSDEEYTIFHHNFISDKGERIHFSFDPFVLNAASLPSEFTFNQETANNRIDFYKFTGFPRSTMARIMREEDWKKYNCSGTFTVLETFGYANGHISKGTFSMDIYDNQQLYITTENGMFVINH